MCRNIFTLKLGGGQVTVQPVDHWLALKQVIELSARTSRPEAESGNIQRWMIAPLSTLRRCNRCGGLVVNKYRKRVIFTFWTRTGNVYWHLAWWICSTIHTHFAWVAGFVNLFKLMLVLSFLFELAFRWSFTYPVLKKHCGSSLCILAGKLPPKNTANTNCQKDFEPNARGIWIGENHLAIVPNRDKTYFSMCLWS